MANGVIGALRVMLGMDTAEFEKGSDRAQREAARLQKNLQKTASSLKSTGQTLTLALTAPLAAFAAKGISEAQQSAAAIAQVEAALASMGPVAGRTAEQLEQAASAFETKSLFEADVILKDVTANLLTFGNIAGTSFDRAQQAAIDLATRLNVGPREAAIQVGKALNDPIKGITALGRAGIQFSEDQKAMIKALVQTGDVAGAQGIILGELERQFGGAAQAAQNADPINAFTDALNSLAETVGKVLLPVLTPIVTALTDFANGFATLPEGAQIAIVALGGIAAAVGPLLIAAGAMVSAFATLAPVIAGLSIPLAPVAAALAAVAAVGVVVYQNWDKVLPVLDALAEKFQTSIGEPLRAMVDEAAAKFKELWAGPLGELVRGAMSLLGEFALATAGALGEYLLRILSAAAQAVGGAFNAILDALTIVSRFLQGDFKGAWEAAGQFVSGIATTIYNVINSLFPELVQLGKDIIRGIIAGIKAAPGAVREALVNVIQSGVDSVKDFLGIRSPSRLFMEIGGHIMDGLAIGIRNGEGPVGEALSGVNGLFDVMEEGAEKTEGQTTRLADSFATMAQNISGSLRSLVDGIKSGDFFDIFDSILGIVTQLGGSGLFGKGFQSFIGSLGNSGLTGAQAPGWLGKVPGFAQGGAMRLGGMAGIDRNVLSLNGSPIARVSAGETMEIRNGNRPVGQTVVNNYYTLPSDEFWSRVDVRARGQVASAAPSIANAGAQRAMERMRQNQSRSLA